MECLKSGLGIFLKRSIQTSVNSHTVTYKPTAPADNPAQLEFNCSGHSDYYIDVNSVRLLLRIKIVKTICFCCGIGIHDWRPSDNAWQEHARCSPFCVYVRYIRGPTFVHESRRLGSSQNPDWQEDVLVLT